jgi:uncharacterized membrane protein HdeD (DUF308 family)
MNRITNELAIKQLTENWAIYVGTGFYLITLGTLALIFSNVTTLVSVTLLGLFIIFLGAFEFTTSIKINKLTSFFFHLFISFLYWISGFYMIIRPTLSAATLTLLFAILFVTAGIMRIVASLFDAPHRWWLLLNGLLSLVLGILLWQQWPYSGVWFIGSILGIESILTGWTWMMLGIKAKKYKSEISK